MGQENPLGEEMATHSSMLAWRIPWTEDPAGLQSMGCKELEVTDQLNNNKSGFPDSSIGKNPPAMQETWVRSPGWEDLLEKGKATHSSILAWRIPWTV